MASGRAAAFAEGSRRKLPDIVFANEDWRFVFIGRCDLSQFVRDGIVWLSLADQCRKVGVTFQRVPEILLKAYQVVGLCTADTGSGSKLMTVTEYAEFTATASETHEIARVGTYPVLLQQIPDVTLLPVTDWTEAVDMAGIPAVPKVSLVRFKDSITGTLFAFLAPFTRENEGADVLEPLLMTEGRSAHVNLQIGTAPADTQVGRRLRELVSCGRFAPVAASLADCSVWQLETDGSRQAFCACHFTLEAAYFPLEIDWNTEGGTQFAAIVGRDFPVKEASASAVDFLMPQLNFLAGYAVIKKEE